MMPQLNLFGNTSIFADTGSTDIFGNQSSDIFAASSAATDIFENDTQDVQIFAWIDYDDEDEESEHTRLESSITYILENVIPNPSTSEGVMIAHVLNSFLDLLD